ncbi:MAG: NUDIX domain-containing protein, partial [Desulforhopalus sp.]
SFKYGDSEGRDNRGRFFNNYSTAAMQQLLGQFAEVKIIDIHESVSPLRGQEQRWLNIYVARLYA